MDKLLHVRTKLWDWNGMPFFPQRVCISNELYSHCVEKDLKDQGVGQLFVDQNSPLQSQQLHSFFHYGGLVWVAKYSQPMPIKYDSKL